MIVKQDIENVKTIAEKVRQNADTESEWQKLDQLIRGLEKAGAKYLKEVNHNARL